jgi:hypothetical protein
VALQEFPSGWIDLGKEIFLSSLSPEIDFLKVMREASAMAHIQNVSSTKRLLNKTSPQQNVSIQNVYTHNVSLTKRLRNQTSPVTKRLRNETSPRHIFIVLDRLFKKWLPYRVLSLVVRLGSAVKVR